MPLLGVNHDDDPRGSSSHAYLNVGLEVEILLRPRNFSGQGLHPFTEHLSMNHNNMIPKGQRKMHSDLRGN